MIKEKQLVTWTLATMICHWNWAPIFSSMFQQEFDEAVYGVKSCKEQALRGFGNRGSLKEPPPSADPMSSLLSLPLSSIAEKLAKLKTV